MFNPVLPTYDAKFAGAGGSPDKYRLVNQSGLSRKVPIYDVFLLMRYDLFIIRNMQHIFDAIKASLKRLQLDYVDLYQCVLLVLSLIC